MREGFPVKRLGEVCEVIAGQSPEGKYYNSEGIGLPFYQGKKEFREKFIGEPTTWTSKITKEAIENDILMSVRAPVGPVNFSTQKICIGRGLAAIRATEAIDKEYLFYFLIKHESEIESNAGAVFNSISKTQIGNIRIPLPPLPEQHQIVVLLDQAFAAIDQAKANLEKNIENAKELFQAKLNEVFSQKGEGWEEKRLKNFGIVQTGITPPTKDKSNYGNFIPFVKPAHFCSDGSIVSGDSMLSKRGLSKGRLFGSNSILMVCIGATIGKTGYSEIPVSSNQQINAITPNEKYVPKILYYALISLFVQNQVLSIGKGAQATLPIINKSKWSNLLIRVPGNRQEQEKIIENLDAIRGAAMELESSYNAKLLQFEDLKKSLLQKAFAGELIEKMFEFD